MSCQSCQSCRDHSDETPNKRMTFGLPDTVDCVNGSFITRFVNAVKKSPDIEQVDTSTTPNLLANYSRCDAIIIFPCRSTPFSSRHQKALYVVEKPVYMCYTGDAKIANDNIAEAMISDYRKLQANYDADVEDVIAAICEHIENPCDRSVQQIYDGLAKDRRVTLWIGQRGEVISSLVLSETCPPVYATVSGTRVAVDNFVKAFADKLAVPVQNKDCYHTERFLACFIEMKKDHGFGVEDDLQLLMDIVIGRPFLFQTVIHKCTIDLSQRT